MLIQDSAGIRRIGQIAITVRDTPTAKAFYRDVLGLTHLFDAPPAMSFFDCGGVRLLLGQAEDTAQPAASSILYLDVPDITAAHAVLAARGVSFIHEPHSVADLGDRVLWLAFFHDCDRNTLALMSEVPKEPPTSAARA
ncbi:MAG: VOC family protein [Gemmatimonadota bacterium]